MKMGLKLQSWFRRRRSKEEKTSGMVLTVTEDTPADMLAGSMELLVHVPGEYHDHTQKVTVERSMAMMDLLVQIATAHKLAASSYTLQAIGEHGSVLPHQPNTPIGALDALEVKLLPKQGTFIPRKAKQSSQPFETTFRLQVHLPRNQLYVSRVSPKTKLGEILDEVCREKNLSRNKYELRHPGNHNQTLDLSLSLQDYQLQEVTLYAKQGQSLGSALSSQDIMALQRQEERRRQQAKQGIFGFMFRKSKESSLSTDSLGGRSVSPARSDEIGRSVSPLVPPPTRPQRKRRPAPNPPARQTALQPQQQHTNDNAVKDESSKDKLVISHSRNSSDSSGYHEASVLSDNPDSAGRMPETLPRRSRPPGKFEARKLAQTSQASKSLCNLATCSGALSHAVSNTSLSSTGIRKKRAAPKPPISRPLSSAISTQALERIVDSEESLTSDMGVSKPPSDIAVSSETEANSKANSDIVVGSHAAKLVPKNFYHAKESATDDTSTCDDTNKRHSIAKLESHQLHLPPVADESPASVPIEEAKEVDSARVVPRVGAPVPKPRSVLRGPVVAPRRRENLEQANMDAQIHIDELPQLKIALQKNTETLPVAMITPAASNNEEIQAINETLSEQSRQTDVETLDENFLQASCAVVSIIPKCSHLSELTVPLPLDNNVVDNQVDEVTEEDLNNPKLLDESLAMKKSKIFRTQSDVNNFELNRLNMPGTRHYSQATLICALNPNVSVETPHVEVNEKLRVDVKKERNALSENATPSKEQYPPFITHRTNLGLRVVDLVHSADNEELHSQGIGKAGAENIHDTDLLLQKVSTTLANVLPTSDASSQNMASSVATVLKPSEPLEKNGTTGDEETGLDATPNLTLNSQQDTSDYVSATGDLSTSEWQYQLPDPPSAFRDTALPDHDDYDTITLRSVEVFKESTSVVEKNLPKKAPKPEDIIKQPVNTSNPTPKIKNSEDTVNSEVSQESFKRNSSIELRRDVISELETKIENGLLQQTVKKTSDEEFKRESVSIPAPKIVSNTLPNFRITTYAGDKQINIYDTPEESEIYADRLQDRFLKSFATLSRNTTSMKMDNYTSAEKKEGESNLRMDNSPITRTQSVQHIQSMDSEKFTNFMTKDMEAVTVRKHEVNSNNSEDKNNVVHRSKSYIVLSPSSKYRVRKPLDVADGRQVIKSTSITNLNQESSKDDEKLLQSYRESTAKKQNVSLHEKELQSVQVLKRILPQLTANKQAEDETTLAISRNGHESDEKEFAMQPKQMVISSAIKAKPDQENVSKKSESEETFVRYKYTGPPTVSISSWSERPSVNVKTTTDTDYKIGTTDNTTGAKTVVNLNGSSNDNMSMRNYNDSSVKNLPKNYEKINHSDISNDNQNVKKIITNNDTGFNNFGLVKLRARVKNDEEDKPVVTKMAGKKYTEKPEFNDDDVKIDTRPVNFKALSQTFGKITLRSKSNYNSHNTAHHRNSEYIDRRDAAMEFTDVKKVPEVSRVPIKKYTSIVGIDSQQYSANNARNDDIVKNSCNSTLKINGSITPVVRGFQIQLPSETHTIPPGNKPSHVVPAPPSMPVITGVTLKSNNSRPKSMPICEDPRDQLLASIRTFGRDKLKNINATS